VSRSACGWCISTSLAPKAVRFAVTVPRCWTHCPQLQPFVLHIRFFRAVPLLNASEIAITTVVVNIRDTIPAQPKVNFPPNAKPGFQVFFTEDVVLKPVPNQPEHFVGIHSGILTLLRVTGSGDRFYAPATRIYQYLATYRFRNLPNTPLSQITAHGDLVFSLATHTVVEQPITYAITGGTGAFANARGRIVEDSQTNDRELRIEL
jgi:hypothetical protein